MTQPRVAGIYMITHTASNRKYVGSSLSIRNRWNVHRSELRRGVHGNPHLQRCWTKYGEETFTFEVILELPVSISRDELLRWEQHFLDTLNPEFNASKTAVHPGRQPCKTRSEEHCRNISRALKGKPKDPEHMRRITELARAKNHWKGRTHTEKTKEKLRQANLGKTQSEETKRKRSEARKGKKHSEEVKRRIGEAGRGRTHSEEARQKMSEARKGKPRSEVANQKLRDFYAQNGVSPETRAKISATGMGRKPSEETRRKRSESLKEYHRKKREGGL